MSKISRYVPLNTDVVVRSLADVQFSFSNTILTTSVAGSYDDSNALANITIAGWSRDDGNAACSAVEIMADGKRLDSKNIKIIIDESAVYVTGLEGVAKAFHANLSISFT
jgi:alpha-glucosidase